MKDTAVIHIELGHENRGRSGIVPSLAVNLLEKKVTDFIKRLRIDTTWKLSGNSSVSVTVDRPDTVTIMLGDRNADD